jgi:hypothetical protein
LQADDFEGLKKDLEKMVETCTKKQPPNFTLAHRLTQGLEKIQELRNIESTPSDVLRTMSRAVIDRDLHRIYLDQVREGIGQIEVAQNKWRKELDFAVADLKAALSFSMKLTLPKQIQEKGKEIGLRFQSASKYIERMNEVSRQDMGGCSYVPMRSYTLKHMVQQNIVKEVLGELKTFQARAELTFTLREDGVGVQIIVQPKKDTKKTLKNMKIPNEKIRELRRASEEDEMELPIGDSAPMLIMASAKLTVVLSNLSTGLAS